MTTAPSPDAVRDFAAEAGLSQPGDTCDGDTLSARAAFWRLVDDRRSASGSTSPEIRADEGALRVANLVQQINCYPTDGMAWADLAAATVAHGGRREDVTRYLRISQDYAPFDGQAVIIRISLLAPISDHLTGDANDILVRDLATAIDYLPPPRVASALAELGPDRRASVDDYLASLKEDRRTAIERAIQASTGAGGQ